MYADVVFPLKLSALTYKMPSHAPPDLIGRVVKAPLGGKSHYGLIVNVQEEPEMVGSPQAGRLKNGILKIRDIESIHDHFAGESMVIFLKWLSEYYLAPLGIALKSLFFNESIQAMTESEVRTKRRREGSPGHESQPRGEHGGQSSGSGREEPLSEAASSLCGSVEQRTYSSFLFHAPSARSQYSLLSKVIEKIHPHISGAIILVPEIEQIEQLLHMIGGIVGGRVSVLHSRLSKSRRIETIKRIGLHASDIVIGTRSAILAPLKKVSFIAVMNEQSPSYKGEEGLRYSGRDVAVMRGFLEKSPVLLSSPCPSVESAYNAAIGKYALIGIPHDKGDGEQPVIDGRTGGEAAQRRSPLFSPRGEGDLHVRPRIRIISMRERRFGTASLSRESLAKTRSLLSAKESVLLLANRKGYSIMRCEDCGHVPACPGCQVPLVFYKGKGMLKCHYCGREERLPGSCEKCRGFAIAPYGTGTEKLLEEVQDLLKTRAVLVEKRTKRFGLQRPDLKEADLTPLIVGTLHAARKVSERGFSAAVFLNIDPLLSRPDFRAYERGFQEVVQVSQAVKPEGVLLIQSWTPENRLLRFLRNYDFKGFYEYEYSQRKALNYPPFSKLILFTICLKHEGRGLSKRIEEAVDRIDRSRVEVLGPVEIQTPGKAHGVCLQILLKSKESKMIHAVARGLLADLEKQKGLRITLDVDPLKV